MKKFIFFFIIILIFIASSFTLFHPQSVFAKSRISSYYRSSGTRVRSYIRYKADGYKFNNYVYRPDRGYHR